jgi:signal transduction histidine kinase
MITPSSDFSTKSRAMELGVSDFICVPLQKAELELRLHAIIQSRRHYLNFLQTQTLLQKSEYLHYVTAGIAHKFNNLLHIIQNCSDLTGMLLALHTYEFDVLKRHIQASCEKTTNAVEQGKVLIEQIVNYSQRENQQKDSHGTIPLAAFLSSQQPLLNALFAADTTFSLTTCQDTQSVLVYSITFENLSKILRNLCLNALDALSQTQENRHVQLRAETVTVDKKLSCACCHKAYSGHYLKLAITDNGQGIAERIMPSIFDPFFTTKGVLHSGLGLTEVAGLVHNAHGFMTVTSQAEVNTTFCIFLPFEFA